MAVQSTNPVADVLSFDRSGAKIIVEEDQETLYWIAGKIDSAMHVGRPAAVAMARAALEAAPRK